jgi:hypothetical protein
MLPERKWRLGRGRREKVDLPFHQSSRAFNSFQLAKYLLLAGLSTLCRSGTSASAAVSCSSFCGDLTARYTKDGQCSIAVETSITPFNDCGAALPGRLQICLFRGQPSSIGGTLVGCCTSDCRRDDGEESWSCTLSTSGTGPFFVEGWIDPGNSALPLRCPDVDFVRLPAFLSGDADGDGVLNCADNCPNYANYTQLDVDFDRRGDPCDPSKGDLNSDGSTDAEDLQILLGCLVDDGVVFAPPGCTESEFEAADLDGDLDVDFVDFAALQVFLE